MAVILEFDYVASFDPLYMYGIKFACLLRTCCGRESNYTQYEKNIPFYLTVSIIKLFSTTSHSKKPLTHT